VYSLCQEAFFMSTWTSERARIAALKRGIRAGERPADDPALAEAQRNLRELKAAEYIEKVLSQAPALTDAQRTRLAELFRPFRHGGDA
jgi:hypothetical protein